MRSRLLCLLALVCVVVACSLKVDAQVSIPGGYPYGYNFNQTPLAQSGLLITGYDGAHVQPIAVGTNGVLLVQGVSGMYPIAVSGTVTGSGTFTFGGNIGTVQQDSNNGLLVGGEVQPTNAPTPGGYVPVTNYQNSAGLAVPVAADQSVPIAIATATASTSTVPSTLVAGVAGKSIYVTGYHYYLSGQTTSLALNFVYGTTTTTPCDTGTTYLDGSPTSTYLVPGNLDHFFGGALGAIWKIPAGNSFCLFYYAQAGASTFRDSGYVLYAQF